MQRSQTPDSGGKRVQRRIALAFLLLAILGEVVHLIAVTCLPHRILISNLVQLFYPLLAVGVSWHQRSRVEDAISKRCWMAVLSAFAIWAGAQVVYLRSLSSPVVSLGGVRMDDALWLLYGLPLLLAVHTSRDELDAVQWLDRAQAIFFFIVLYLMVFLHAASVALSKAYLIQNLALALCCLLRIPTCTSSRERHFFERLTIFLLAYGGFETLGEALYRRGWQVGTPVDLVWTLPIATFLVLVQLGELTSWNSGIDSNRFVNMIRQGKGLNIAALTFLSMGVSALLATHYPLLGGSCVVCCFALFALRTSAREHAWDAAHDRLTETVLQDALTGLGNRVQLRNSLSTRLAEQNTAGQTALLFVDLDRFKAINDSLGHAAGDALLIQVSQRLRSAASGDALVCRIGGDEFVILTPADDAEAAQAAGEALLDALRPAYEVRGHILRCTASIGVVLVEPGSDLDDLIRTADQAMYRAKQLGKDRVQLFDAAVLEKINNRWRLEADLRIWVERNGIDIAFQPILKIESGRIEGFEALARWDHPQLGQVPPSEFVPLAEDTGLILRLGAQLLEKACRQVARWNEAWNTSFSISVNVSPRQFADPHFVDMVFATLAETGLPPGLLRLEITESVLLVHENTVRQVLAELQAHGISISLDDFGTGYSSLSFLLNLPVDEVKVDKSFVSHMHHHPQRRELVRTVVQLGQSLSKRVVAEGVETEQELSALASMGCECAQGWLISKPLPAAVMEREIDHISARMGDMNTLVVRTCEFGDKLSRKATPWRALLGRGEPALKPLS